MVDGVAANVDVAGFSVTSDYAGATSSRSVLGFEYFQFLDTVDGTDIKIDASGVPSSNGPTDVSLSLLNPFFYDGISGELAIDSLLLDVVASQAPGTVTVTADFTDVDATDAHGFSVDATATNGTVTDNGDGTFSYSTNGHYDYLGAGEEATDTFTYTVLDQAGGSDTKTVTITVTGTNDVPVAVAGSATVEERVSQTISVLPLVTEIDATDTPVYFIDDSLTIGSVTDNGDGTFEYDPAGNFNGLANGETAQDIVVFVVDDGNGGTAFNTVTITIEGANERPVVIGSQSFSTNEDSAVSELNLLANASDANGDTIGVTELQVTASDGRPVAFAYDSGSDSFSLDPSQFNDLGGDESVDVTVSYNVVESDRSYAGADAGARSLTNSGTFYISDSDSGALHIVERGVNGVASFEDALQALSDSGISVTNGTALLLDENGGATSGLAVSARSIGNGVVSVAEADVDLAGYTGGITTASTVPPSYVAFFDAFTATTLTVTVTQPDIRCGPSEHVFTFSDVSQTAGKEVDIASMTLNVAALGAEVSEVITIMGVNDAPEATAKSVTIDEDGSINVAVLQGATDADGDNVGLDSVTQGANGSVVIESDGTVTYEANADFNGTDSFTFTLSDGNGGTVTETVNVTVNAVNDAPVTDSESVSLDEDSSVNIAVLDGDTDVDGDVLTVDSVTQGANGSVAIQTDGTVTYTANANYNGTDSFTYTVSDGNGALVTETVNVTVNPVNDAPIANALSGEVTESATVTELTGAIEADSLVPNLGRFYLFDFDTGATTTVLRDTGSSNTEAQVASQHFSDGNGVVIHINPNVDGWGIAFALFDNEGQVDVLASDLTVTGSAAALPSAPGDISLAFANGAQNVDEISLATQITLSDGRVVDFDAALFGIDYEVNTTEDLEVDAARFNAVITDPSTDEITLTADFTDVEVGDSHTFSVNDSGTLGSVINNGDGTFTYSANGQFEHLSEGETATDSFDYIVNDGNGGTSTATATITIFGQNDGPVTSNVNAGSVEEDDAAVTIDLLANATDAENDALTVSGISLSDGTGSPVSFTDNGDGTIDIDPSQYSALESGESATITVTYTVSDGAVSVQGTAQLVVNGATTPTPPVAVDDDYTASAVTDEDTTYVFSAAELVGNDSDVNGDTLSVASVSSFSTLGATVVLNGDGTVSYAPGSSATLDALASGDTLVDSFTYVVSDGNGGTDTATVSLQISGVNDAPILTNSLVAQSGFTADAFSYTLPSDLFTDHDENGAITYSVTLDDGSPLPSFLNFDAATRTLSYAANAPAVSDIGLYSLQVTATEVDGQFSTTGFTLTVLDGTLISGTSASEVLNGTIQGDLMRGLGGNDTLNGLSSSDVMDGGEGNDRLNGDAGDDVLIGGAGNDYLFGEEGNDNLFGGDDNDYLDQGDGTGLLDGGAGNDTLRASYDSEGSSETLIGGDGDDTIQTVGWRSTDVVDAGAGNDYVELRGYGFNGDEGGGTITLGTGADVLNLSNGHNLSQYSVFRVTDFNVAEDIVRIDDFLNSRLSGWDGVTNPFAAGYMQLVDDGAGNAVLQVDTNGGGDSYQDVIVFEGLAASSLTGLNFDSAWPPDGSLPAGQFITGTTGNDNITGTIGGDTIEALEGNDTLNGAAGSDSLDGGDGADQIRGDAGADTILGGEGNDFLYGQEGNDDIFGGDGRDYLFQDRGYGTLDGGAGDDYIYASTDCSVNNATQTLIGGAGNDVFYNVGRYSVDTVDAGADNDTVNLNGYGYSATRMGGAI
ncbi:MAG: tandem-95 repeat protein, partial [Fuerstiella sp.]|nr:tandem-95 repeat protein [Fuerstiella sp.]